MENDELKRWWSEMPIGDTTWSEKRIEEALRGRSKSAVDRMKRNLWIEIALIQIGIVVLAWTALTVHPGPTRWLMLLMLICYVPLGVYFFLKLQLLARFDFKVTDLHTNLQSLIHNMESFLKVYLMIYHWSLAIFYGLGLLTVFLELGAEKVQGFLFSTRGVIFFVGYTLAVAVTIAIGRWYIKKLYGDHLRHLRSVLGELTDDQDSEVGV